MKTYKIIPSPVFFYAALILFIGEILLGMIGLKPISGFVIPVVLLLLSIIYGKIKEVEIEDEGDDI